MVDEALGRDLMSFGTPILVLGDPGQLPPISGGGFFTEHEPDFLLTEIHRQARDNPIIRLAMHVREGNEIMHGDYGTAQVIGKNDVDRDLVLERRPGAGRHQPHPPPLQSAPARAQGL
jgi:exodeoxyribonuclease-5